MGWRRHSWARRGAGIAWVLALTACSPPPARHSAVAPDTPANGAAAPAVASSGGALETTVPLEEERGTFVVPARINDAVDLRFIIDSGASDINIPGDVAERLMRSGVISQQDFIGGRIAILADGARIPLSEFRIRSLQVGALELKDVTASVSSRSGPLLLGQSFLARLTSWSIDNQRHALILTTTDGSAAGAAPGQPSGATPAMSTAPSVPLSQAAPQGDASAAARDALSKATGFFAAFSAAYNPGGGAQRGYYASIVDYYGASMSVDEVMRQTTEFCRRWPIRRYVVRPQSLTVTCAASNACRVSGVVDWGAIRSDRGARATGTADFTFAFRDGLIETQVGRTFSQLPNGGGS